MPTDGTAHLLMELQVRRKFLISATTKNTNMAGALVRRALGWRFDDPAKEAVNRRAAGILSAALAGKPPKADDAAVATALAGDIGVVAKVVASYDAARHEVEAEMRRAARRLPVAAWAKGVRGLGEIGLAVIVGEAGDLGGYAHPDKLMKRLGLAPYEGKAFSTWRRAGGLSAEEWTAGGYSPRRRAQIYAVVGDPLFRQQSVCAGPYRQVYDKRRARTAETHPDWSKGHSHGDALRVMTKALVEDLWAEWRRAAA